MNGDYAADMTLVELNWRLNSSKTNTLKFTPYIYIYEAESLGNAPPASIYTISN